MTDPRYTCIQADGKNGQAILDYFKGINPDCNDMFGEKEYLSVDDINSIKDGWNIWLIKNGTLSCKYEIPYGYTLIEI